MKNIFKKHKRGGSDKSRKYPYRATRPEGIYRPVADAIKEAKPEDFSVDQEQQTIYLMSVPMETVTQWVLSVTNKNNVVYTLGRYSSEAQAYRMMRLVIKHRLLPEYHAPTLRELMEQQEVA